MMNPFPAEYEGFGDIAGLISQADVRINNLEMTLTDYDCFASSFCGGTWITAEPGILDELCKFGFNYFSFANNHTMDYSYGGLYSTLKELSARGLAHSGAGMDLVSATRHAALKSKNGSVGILSIASTCDDAARAGNRGHVIPGRPGLNMLRHSEVFKVNRAHMETLKEIAAATMINGRIDNSKKGGYTLEKPGVFSLGPVDFALGDAEGKWTFPNPKDMQRMREAIRAAKDEVDHVIVCFHSHEIPGLTDDEPDYFIRDFCHACIEWGASAMIGSGTHQLKGVEIFKGKPIFYSIANFVFQSTEMRQMPADYYEKYDVTPDKSAKEAIAVRSAGGTRGLQSDFHNYRAIIPSLEFEGDRLISATLTPIELGFEQPEACKGLPYKAVGSAAQEIYVRLARLSVPYGTRLVIDKDSAIAIRLDPMV